MDIFVNRGTNKGKIIITEKKRNEKTHYHF